MGRGADFAAAAPQHGQKRSFKPRGPPSSQEVPVRRLARIASTARLRVHGAARNGASVVHLDQALMKHWLPMWQREERRPVELGTPAACESKARVRGALLAGYKRDPCMPSHGGDGFPARRVGIHTSTDGIRTCLNSVTLSTDSIGYGLIQLLIRPSTKSPYGAPTLPLHLLSHRCPLSNGYDAFEGRCRC